MMNENIQENSLLSEVGYFVKDNAVLIVVPIVAGLLSKCVYHFADYWFNRGLASMAFAMAKYHTEGKDDVIKNTLEEIKDLNVDDLTKVTIHYMK